MLSGEFTHVPLSSITIDRATRQRRELTGIEELAASLKERGQIHPVVVTRELVLIAGERRIAAAQSLGWDQIAVQYVDTVEPDELHALELEENIKRVDLSWQDRTRAIEAYHTLRKATNPDWTPDKTAEAIGISKAHVHRNLSVAKEMKKNPQVAQASKFSAANNLVQRLNERRASIEVTALGKVTQVEKPQLIIEADFTSWAADYTGPKFNFLHCDFPYGINMDKTGQGTHQETMGMYKDTPEIYFNLLRTLVDCQENILSESCHIMFWFHMKYYGATVNSLEAAGFDVNPLPLIWQKSDNTGILSDPNRRPRHIYETALIGARGDRKLVKPKSDAVFSPTEANTFHSANKPLPVLKQFMEMFVDDTTVMLDPTAGSGGAIKMGKILGARHVFGLEINPDFVQQANEWVNK